MKQQDVFNKIGAILNELNEQYDYLKKDTSQLNELELELFVANAHFLMDHADILRKINAQLANEKPALPQPETFQVKIEHQVPVSDFFTVADVEPKTEIPVFEKVEQPKATDFLPPVTEPVYEPEIIEIEEPEIAEPEVIAPEPVAEVEPEPEPVEPVVEKPAAPKPTEVHEQKFFEPVVQQLRPITTNELKDTPKPAPFIDDEDEAQPDDHTTIDADGTIRHELVIDDTDDNWDDEEQPADEPEVFEEDEVIEVEADQPEPEPEAPVFVPAAPAPPVAIEPEPEPVKPAVEVAPPVVVAQTIAVDDKKEEQVFTINQRISVQMAEKSAPPVGAPISDLKAAITLNDKLLYVQDLFNGYSLAYSEAIDILNRFNSFAEAERFLNTNYVTKNNWQAKATTTEKFYALLKRRYA